MKFLVFNGEIIVTIVVTTIKKLKSSSKNDQNKNHLNLRLSKND